MILKGTEIRKAIIIKTESVSNMEFISNMIHSQLIGKRDYIDSKIILSIGDGQNKEIPENEIHIYIMNDCEINPIIAIGKFSSLEPVTVEISVTDEKTEDMYFKDICKQLANNRDYMFGRITLSNSFTNNDINNNEYSITINYCKDRNSTPSLII